MFMEETLGTRNNTERAEEIITKSAKTVATVCPFCATMLRYSIRDKELDVQVKDYY